MSDHKQRYLEEEEQAHCEHAYNMRYGSGCIADIRWLKEQRALAREHATPDIMNAATLREQVCDRLALEKLALLEELATLRAKLAAVESAYESCHASRMHAEAVVQRLGRQLAFKEVYEQRRVAHNLLERRSVSSAVAVIHGVAQSDAARLARKIPEGGAQAKCSCTHEAGDSDCEVHPTCNACGADLSGQVVCWRCPS